MELIADEDIDRPVVKILRQKGFDVLSIDAAMKGASDEEVIEKAVEEGRILVTMDSDFIDINSDHNGVIRLTSFASFKILAQTVAETIEMYSEKDLKNTVVQVSPKRNIS